MTVLVLGANGQVGRELLRALPSRYRTEAATRSGRLANGDACNVADLRDIGSLTALLDRLRPKVVVNAAAYTAVDRAEDELDLAFRVNAEAPGAVAQWCARHDALMVHYSTDYVFDGAGHRPYKPNDPTGPLGVYGESKLAGEQAVLASRAHSMILRTSWVFAAHGHNFLLTMLRLAAERSELRVVADQIGAPTSAALIADVTARILGAVPTGGGLWHLVAAGQTTWHGFAEEIFAQAARAGMIERSPTVVPISSSEFPTPARRPAYSCLDTGSLVETFDVNLPEWREGVAAVLKELRRE